MSIDPDHAHLYKLLSMLPTPKDENFWDVIATANDVDRGYILEKLQSLTLYMEHPTPEPGQNIDHLCLYTIMFFGGDKPVVWEQIAGSMFDIAYEQWEHVGKVFADDLVRTAWTLLVRYGTRGDQRRLAEWMAAFYDLA